MTAVHFEHTPDFAGLLQQLNVSLLVTTYQAGKLLTIGTCEGDLSIGFHNFEQVMGLAVRPECIAVGTKRQVWFLRPAPDLAPRVEPTGKYDGCYLTRSAHFTGPLHGHELAWVGDELWMANTLFSCLCNVRDTFSFVPRWRPPFVSAWASEDRCHLNGLAVDSSGPRFVTLLAESDTPGGWRPTKATTGCIYDVNRNQAIVHGLCMPHSPRLIDDRLFVLNSGRGEVALVDIPDARVATVATLQGYTRGLDFFDRYAFVGLSQIRETSVFGGLPIAAQREGLHCGISVVDCQTGEIVAGIRFHSGIEEVFEVKALPGVRCPVISGPLPDEDGTENIWLVPG